MDSVAPCETDRKPIFPSPNPPPACAIQVTNPLLPAIVVVTLTVVSQPIAHEKRSFCFTRESRVVHLGRASKTQAKGRVSSRENGLFDSPVMSRDHAELVADIDAKVSIVQRVPR
jgi:hypothetical protein